MKHMFVHLTTHSAYSLGEGLALPEDLARAAAGYGMPALGLTDHRLLSGSVEFAVACQRVRGVACLVVSAVSRYCGSQDEQVELFGVEGHLYCGKLSLGDIPERPTKVASPGLGRFVG